MVVVGVVVSRDVDVGLTARRAISVVSACACLVRSAATSVSAAFTGCDAPTAAAGVNGGNGAEVHVEAGAVAAAGAVAFDVRFTPDRSA